MFGFLSQIITCKELEAANVLAILLEVTENDELSKELATNLILIDYLIDKSLTPPLRKLEETDFFVHLRLCKHGQSTATFVVTRAT